MVLGGTTLITKAIIQSINATGNRCLVRIPLFEYASDADPVEAEALINITPGLFNNLAVGDVVFVAFEEDALEKPVIIGKLFRDASIENNTRGGGCIVDTLQVRSSAAVPASTSFVFPQQVKNNYKDLSTPKKLADYIKWLEAYIKGLITKVDDNFRCFKNWTQWQFRPENIEVDDGDLDTDVEINEAFKCQEEGKLCDICGSACTKNRSRSYFAVSTSKNYPET